MVQTRNQYNRWRDNGFQSTQESCSDCSQESNRSFNNNYEHEETPSGNDNVSSGRYKDNDSCHRHRKSDDQPFGVYVPAHYRRKP
jgi:hypothetical protein